MATLYRAQLVPSKLELITAWAPGQPWWVAGSGRLCLVGSYRFDDPEGEVGIETHLLGTSEGDVIQVPLTYRGEPLVGAEGSLVGTCHHSVLGTRWFYDGCADPVYLYTLAAAILTGGTQADLQVVTPTGYEQREAVTRVWGSGRPGADVPPPGLFSYTHEGTTAVVRSGGLELRILRSVGTTVTEEEGGPGALVLSGTWPGQTRPVLLAAARVVSTMPAPGEPSWRRGS